MIDVGSVFEAHDQRWVVVDITHCPAFGRAAIAATNAPAGVTLCVFDTTRIRSTPPVAKDREIVTRYQVLHRRTSGRLQPAPYIPKVPAQ